MGSAGLTVTFEEINFSSYGLLSTRLSAQPEPDATRLPRPGPAADAPAQAQPADDYQLGGSYRIETVAGAAFTGQLVGLSLTSLEFETQELGHLSLLRSQVQRAEPLAPARAESRPGYFDLGNGNRLFFAPTGRGLRRGEGTLQAVTIYFLGLNYGLTDNVSLGGYVSLLPGLSPNEQLLVLTPKVSFPVGEQLHAGAGLLYMHVPDFDNADSGTDLGIGYGVLTYGSADHNLSLGAGYGFVQGRIGATPLLQLGGQTRVSRRVSLLSENYLLADSRAGLGGLYGIKVNWRRTNLGLAGGYLYTFAYDEVGDPVAPGGRSQVRHVDSTSFWTYVVPVYLDFTFRFGKGAR